MKARNATYPPYLFDKAMAAYQSDFDDFEKIADATKNNEIVGKLREYAHAHGGEVNIFEAIAVFDKNKELRGLGAKIKEKTAERTRRTWGINWNLFRIGLQMHGFVDASTDTGHLMLPKSLKTKKKTRLKL